MTTAEVELWAASTYVNLVLATFLLSSNLALKETFPAPSQLYTTGQQSLPWRKDMHMLETLREFIHTPSSKPIGHNIIAQHSLVCLNRVRTGYGRFKYNMNQMRLPPSASCDCGAAVQTAQHIASECPLHSCNRDLVVLDTAAHNWLRDLPCVVYNSSIKRRKKKQYKESS